MGITMLTLSLDDEWSGYAVRGLPYLLLEFFFEFQSLPQAYSGSGLKWDKKQTDKWLITVLTMCPS